MKMWIFFAGGPEEGESRFSKLHVDEEGAAIRLFDFGSSLIRGDSSERRKVTMATTTRYRAPEVGLRIGWDFSADVWALGVTIYEMYTYEHLLPTSLEAEKVFLVEALFGKIPPV